VSEPTGRPIDFSWVRDPKGIGDAIDVLRKECRPQLANNRLAKKAGVQSATTITNWINGILPQKRENLRKLLIALKAHPVEIDQIMTSFDVLGEARRQQRLLNMPDQLIAATHPQEGHAKTVDEPDQALAVSHSIRPVPLVLAAILTIVAFGFGALTATMVDDITSSASAGTVEPPRGPSTDERELGDVYVPQGEEFLAKLINQATNKCISRNGIYTHPDASERVGENIYQWDCASDNVWRWGPADVQTGHIVALVPIPEGWLIRSSVKIGLCLAANGAPSDDQHFQACEPGDDRQQWILQRDQDVTSDIVVIQNRNTRMCLAHPGGSDIRIFQRPCMLAAATKWAIKRQSPVGTKDCRDQGSTRFRNHETSLYVADGDRPRMNDVGTTLTLRPTGQSAHGCAMHIVGPSANCLGVSSLSAVDVVWMPCNRQPNQRWLIEPLGKQDERSWKQVRPIYDISRCLQQSEKILDALLTAQPCNETWLQQWDLE